MLCVSDSAAPVSRSCTCQLMAVAALLQKFGNFAMFTSQSLPRSSFLSDTVPFVARPLSRVPPLGTTRCYATGVSAMNSIPRPSRAEADLPGHAPL